ncbi:mechanosensitive ion channel domain-containing protein [uncultured Algibacter sp.]|uniref:mechanosensitive ion channel family protein n=1 Tax=uncultured Algibacter sp. TaxID=298659 RepID=UPI0025DC3814|nr:mechanosensitive ion channel domain-containing protein [uncultured Algibacter sp.]
MEHIIDLIVQLLTSWGLSENIASFLSISGLFILLTILIYIVDVVLKKIIRATFTKIANKSKTDFDDIMLENRVPGSIAQIVPYILTYNLIPSLFNGFENGKEFCEKTILLVGIGLTIWGVRNVLNSLKIYFKTLSFLKDKPVDSYIQVFMIFVWMTGIFGTVAIITGISFFKFIAGLGTVSAIIILVFRDTILGFVASIQVSINDMVRIGDWITLEKFGADGDVIEINLATVKVQNFDNTITTIPTYALISDSFKNWRGMDESNGRRIKRSLNIRMESVKNLSQDDILKMSKIQLISDYILQRSQDIKTYNENHTIDKSLLINGRNLTNIGVFRKYMETFIEQHSAINKDMMIMVRQLQPTAQGLPIEIYAFSSDKRWKNYEFIIADIFDHMIASVNDFDLKIAESPLFPASKK